MTRARSTPSKSSPPPRGGRGLLFIGLGIVIAVAMLLVASRLDRGAERTERRIAAPIDVVPPAPLREDERAGGGSGGGEQAIAELERGAWVQVVDERGRLAQQYRAQRVEPLPDRWVSLERPRAQFFQSDGRVITLAADAGRARVSRRALETGSLAGSVEIRIHPAAPGGVEASLAEPPLLVVETDDARFDNVLGEIRCDGPVRVRSGAGSFDGVGLSMLVDPDAAVLERLVVDRATAPIRLDQTRRGTPSPAVAATPPSDEPSVTSAVPAQPQREAEPPRFYRLVLERDVVVTRIRDGRRTTLSGDRLVAVFAMGGSVGDAAVRPRRAAAPAGAASTVAALAFAAGIDEPVPESIEIAYTGRLVLEPAAETERLASADDRSFAMLALRPNAVTIIDESTESTVRCAKASFVEGEDLVEAFGWDDEPLTLASPRLAAEGHHFRLQRALGTGGFLGPGRLRLAAGGEHLADLAPRGDEIAAIDPATGAIRLARSAGSADPKAVAIEWSDGLELRYRAAVGDRVGGALRSARFVGDVAARGEGFEVRSATLEARFAETAGEEDDTPPLQRILAEGDDRAPARARRTDPAQPGRLAARTIDLVLATDASGRAEPSRLDATGGVEALDATQSLFGDRLAVVFRPRDGSARPDSEAIEVATAQAEGDLEIVVRGERAGASSVRAYASRLDGDAGRGVLVLHGDGADGVRIVRDALVADRLGMIELRQAERVATAAGGGRVRTFAAAVGDDRPVRVAFPSLPERPALMAEWSEDFRFVEAPRPGVDGELELSGGVRVRSAPDRSSTDALDARTLLLVLARDPSGADDPRGGVRSMLARGGAIVESRAWTDESRSGDPRLFRIAGEEIFYDLLTREGFVEGAGSLLAHVPEGSRDGGSGAVDGAAADAERIDGPRSALAAEGTTRFRWSRRLDLRRIEGERYQIDMHGDVEVVHLGFGSGGADGDAFAMSAGRLAAGLLRSRDRGDARARGADLGGTAIVESIEARSDDVRRVRIRTGEGDGGFDLECDSFSYSLATRVAVLTAAPGRAVVVTTRDRPQPVRAERVEWNLETGRIAIEGATGRVGR
jgi:hypothetical protein